MQFNFNMRIISDVYAGGMETMFLPGNLASIAGHAVSHALYFF
jgi:hypothetical protein